MSLTQKERHNPPPRQKSCAACIKAKRRCDAAQPACLRCSQRGIPCVMPARRTPPQRGGGSRTSSNVPPAPSMSATSSTPSSTQDFDFISTGIDTPFPLTESDCPEWQGLLSSIDPLLAASSSSKGFDYAVPTPPGRVILENMVADSQSGGFVPGSLETMQPELLEMVHQTSTVAAPTSKPFERLPDVVSRKLSYALDVIEKAPSMMVLETQTPWCHRSLYEHEMPRSMQDAHAACALYLAKNRANAPIIMRSIESKVTDLIETPMPTTPFEILGRAQSLILYHIIRVFDGDIGARAAAERTQSALEDTAMELVMHVDFDCPSPSKLASTTSATQQQQLPLYPLAPTRRFWRDWVFMESARRTLLFTFFFIQAYRVISGQRIEHCDGRLNRCHAFTLSASLWEAEGPLAFAKAWAEGSHIVVENTDFQIAFGEARPQDIDQFGRIMLTSMLGVDEAEGWFASKGGSLRGVAV